MFLYDALHAGGEGGGRGNARNFVSNCVVLGGDMFDIGSHGVVDHQRGLEVAEGAAGLGRFAGLYEPRLGGAVICFE